LKVLDPLLHTLLALNRLSTTVCQSLSAPPVTPPNYVNQRQIIEKAGGEVLFSEEVDVTVEKWGQRWLGKEEKWIGDTLGSDTSTISTGGRLGNDVIEGIFRGSDVVDGVSRVGIYVIKKK